jgi:hypothetical protein
VSRTSKRKRPPPRAQARQNKRSTRTKAPAPAPTRRSSRASSSLPTTNTPRAAKLKARTQLNKQAQELAKYQASLVEHGTRTSARLRGKADGDDDQWQTIPAEWLAESNAVQSTRQSSRLSATRGPNMSSECDSQESDLTELSSDDDGHGSAVDGSSRATDNANSVSAHESTSEVDDDKPVPSDFVEWETVCGLPSVLVGLYSEYQQDRSHVDRVGACHGSLRRFDKLPREGSSQASLLEYSACSDRASPGSSRSRDALTWLTHS